MKCPYLSVITPVFQGEKYISECIESVIQQECNELEHIIVDGGSTDGTIDIIKKYAGQHEHIRFISEKDNGQSHAMNKGLALAQGRVVGFLNADDYYEPKVLNKIVKIFSALSEPSFLVGNCYVRDENKNVLFENIPKRLKQEDILLGFGINPFPINPSAYFYDKSAHKKIGFYNEDDHYSMDVEFILKIVTVAHIKYINEFWGNFRCIKGTKTYEDIKSGANSKRVQGLMDTYINKLSFVKRIRTRILKHSKIGYIYFRIGYYIEDPKRILGYLSRNLNKLQLKIHNS